MSRQPTLEETNRLFQLQTEMSPEDALLLSQALQGDKDAIGNFALRAWQDCHVSFPRTQALEILLEVTEPEIDLSCFDTPAAEVEL